MRDGHGYQVELINELKAKIEADGAIEQKTYDKFACWCETTTQRKADAIDAGKKLIGRRRRDRAFFQSASF